ncbi:alpha-mannosidase [Enterococcus sp. HY326]|uniref:alpha-mannosidase n=1 Tax=Enterococcus sp. HY326 TaxID=2971265 RepID=UPI00223FF9A9|nr:alpha-mannosidase [Enterococcus sp. HY326]
MIEQYLTIKKLRKRIDELKNYRYSQLINLQDWQAQEDISKEELFPPKDFSGKISLGEQWRGRDLYLWVQKEVEIPDDENLWFIFDFGRTGGGYNDGFESLMFINGEPYQGVDSNHKEVYVDPKYRNQKINVSLKLWSGLEGGGPEIIQVHEFRTAELAKQRPTADDLFFLSDMVLKTAQQLADDNPNKYLLVKQLNNAFNLIDWSYPGSATFYQSVKESDHFLNQEIDKLPKDAKVEITAIGHTHIDVAWLWRLKHTGEKAARSFSTVLRLMEQYPEYEFLQTQPQIYKYIKQAYPDLYKKIKERIAEGRWEVDGAMWLEADCNIPSGESLTRQILHGKKFVKEEFDKDMHYLWLPDVFGYSWALPQILKKSGIETFMTTKISWNQFNRMPHDTFYWRGIDGTDILTHFITTPVVGENNDWAEEWFYTYNGELEPESVLGIYKGYADKELNSNLLLSYGHGDGGGGVTRDMLENRRRMDRIPGLPAVKTGKVNDYFTKLHETIDYATDPVHIWDGELYLEYHRGTYTSQAFVKKMNRKIELALRKLEILYSFKEMQEAQTYPKTQLYDIWEVLLRNQFHDIIPGSSIKEVYQDHKKEIAEVLTELEQLTNEFTTANQDKLTLINTANWQRNTLVTIPEKRTGIYKDATGKVIQSVKEADGYTLLIENIEQFAQVKLEFEEGTTAKTQKKAVSQVAENSLETDFYHLSWNQKGQLTSIFDKEASREVLEGKGNVLQLFEDKPLNYDAWDIDIFYKEKVIELEADSITIVENNSIYTSILFEYSFGKSTLSQEMRIYNHTKRIDFLTKSHWEERQRLLKARFNVNIRNTEATFDIQYGNVKRPTHSNTSWNFAQFESVGHQWADFSERNYGVSLLNDSKYGYDIKENVMGLTLLKGGIYPDPTADIGDHEFIYSLLPHQGDFVAGKTVEEAWEINDSLAVANGVDLESLNFKLEAADQVPLMVDALKVAEDGNGWILRVHDHTGGSRKVNLSIPTKEIIATNLMEKNEEKLGNNAIEFDLTPYEIKTFRIVK